MLDIIKTSAFYSQYLAAVMVLLPVIAAGNKLRWNILNLKSINIIPRLFTAYIFITCYIQLNMTAEYFIDGTNMNTANHMLMLDVFFVTVLLQILQNKEWPAAVIFASLITSSIWLVNNVLRLFFFGKAYSFYICITFESLIVFLIAAIILKDIRDYNYKTDNLFNLSLRICLGLIVYSFGSFFYFLFTSLYQAGIVPDNDVYKTLFFFTMLFSSAATIFKHYTFYKGISWISFK